MTGFLPFIFLIATMFFGVYWGKDTKRPLWMAFAIPATLVSGGLIVAIMFGEPMREWGRTLSYISPFIPAIWLIYGGLSYFVARRNRSSEYQ
jgi:hypothetical protein